MSIKCQNMPKHAETTVNNDMQYVSTNAFKKTHRLHMYMSDSICPLGVGSMTDVIMFSPVELTCLPKRVSPGLAIGRNSPMLSQVVSLTFQRHQ